MALLILRTVLGTTAIIYGIAQLPGEGNISLSILAGAVFNTIGGALLIIGLTTPIIALIACFCSLAIAVSKISSAPADAIEPFLSLIYISVTALALAFLGPGAFSLDALMFGRREILIPGKSNAPKN